MCGSTDDLISSSVYVLNMEILTEIHLVL